MSPQPGAFRRGEMLLSETSSAAGLQKSGFNATAVAPGATFFVASPFPYQSLHDNTMAPGPAQLIPTPFAHEMLRSAVSAAEPLFPASSIPAAVFRYAVFENAPALSPLRTMPRPV